MFAASPEFELFWNLVSVIFSEDSRNRISVLSGGKEKWMPKVAEVIDEDVVNKLIKSNSEGGKGKRLLKFL